MYEMYQLPNPNYARVWHVMHNMATTGLSQVVTEPSPIQKLRKKRLKYLYMALITIGFLVVAAIVITLSVVLSRPSTTLTSSHETTSTSASPTTPTGPPSLLWSVSVDVSIYEVAILQDGAVVVACADEGVRVFDQTGRLDDHPAIVSPAEYEVNGVAVNQHDSTIVAVEETDGDAILHVYSEGDGWTQSTYQGCKYPWPVIIVSDGFIIGNYGPYLLCKISTTFDLIWTIEDLENQPQAMSLTEAGNIWVQLYGDSEIHEYNSDGSSTSNIIETGADGASISASGVAVWMDYIYLGDTISNTILVYTLQGEYIRTLLTLEGRPWYIHLRDGYLAVVFADEDGNNVISNYQL